MKPKSGRSRSNKNDDTTNDEEEESGKMFVGGLSWQTTQDSLLAFFGRWGAVVDCVVMKNGDTGRSRGFGFVTFSDAGNVARVLHDGPHHLDGRTIDPKPCNPRSLQSRLSVRGQPYPKVFLGGLPANVTETDLRNFFGKFGHVMEVVIMYDQEKRKSRGFGFLSFEQQESVERVVKLQYVCLSGKQVEVKRAEPRESLRLHAGVTSLTHSLTLPPPPPPPQQHQQLTRPPAITAALQLVGEQCVQRPQRHLLTTLVGSVGARWQHKAVASNAGPSLMAWPMAPSAAPPGAVAAAGYLHSTTAVLTPAMHYNTATAGAAAYESPPPSLPHPYAATPAGWSCVPYPLAGYIKTPYHHQQQQQMQLVPFSVGGGAAALSACVPPPAPTHSLSCYPVDGGYATHLISYSTALPAVPHALPPPSSAALPPPPAVVCHPLLRPTRCQ